MKKRKKQNIKITYIYKNDDAGELRLGKAFDILFNEMDRRGYFKNSKDKEKTTDFSWKLSRK
ncbi:MAG: hypothetical protein UW73_C0028G0006 [Microgenomates group bacterium GW2011_GWB1_44_8]|nr:MAG: hypothetical protein UW73_C0028G0006 [Microgenomates group bacterium GW2011_GWB1_44_8]